MVHLNSSDKNDRIDSNVSERLEYRKLDEVGSHPVNNKSPCKITLPEKINEHEGQREKSLTSVKETGGTTIQDSRASHSEERIRIWTQVLVSVAAGLCQFGMGGIYGISGVISPLLTDSQADDLILNKLQISLFSSIVNIGNLAGAVGAGPVMTWLGQRKSLLMATPTGILAWITISLAPSFGVLIAARLISGFAIGVIQCNTHNYLIELAHPTVRGRLLAINDLLCQAGFAVTALIGTFGLTWRQQGFLQIPAFLLAFLILLSMHDSPRWLIMRNRHKDAFKSLLFYRGKDFDVKKELAGIISQESSKDKKLSVSTQLKLMRSREILPTLLVTGFIVLIFHWGGNCIAVSYTVDIMKSTKVSIDPYMSATVSSSSRIVGGFTYIMIADRFTRKKLLCVPLLLASISMAIFGSFFYIQKSYDVSSIEWLPLTTFVAFGYFTAIYYPVILMVRGELLPNSVRSLGTGIHFCLVSVGMFIVTAAYPFMIDTIGSNWTYWIYATAGFFLFTIIALLIPETKGKTLEEIEAIATNKANKKNKQVGP